MQLATSCGSQRWSTLRLAAAKARPVKSTTSFTETMGRAGLVLAGHDSLNLEHLEPGPTQRDLDQTGGIRWEAAEPLGIALRTLHYKLERYGFR